MYRRLSDLKQHQYRGYIYHKKTLTFIGTAGAITNIILGFLLIPEYGIMGAAYVTLISFILFFILTYIFSMKVYPIQYEKKRIFGLFILAFVLFFFGRQVSLSSENGAVSMLLKLLFVFSFPLLLFPFRFFTAEEKAKIKNFLKGIPRILKTE